MSRPRWVDLAGWTWLVAVAGFLTFFLLPRKGVDFGDEGWVLTASLAVVRGWHWDQVIPQAPTWAVNALLMAGGIQSYLALRWAFYGLISLCLAIALLALEPRQRMSGIKAGLVTLAGLTTLSSLIAYNTTPHYLILAGVGLLLLTADVQRHAVRAPLVLLAALTASMGGFLNFTMYPAVFASLVLVWLVGGRARPVAAAVLLAGAVSGVAVGWYVHEIGLAQFVRAPGAHGIHPSRLLSGLRVVLEWVVPAVGIRLGTDVAWRKHPVEIRRRWQARTAAILVFVVSVLLLSVLLSRLQVCECGGTAVSALFNGLHLPGMVIATWGLAVLVLSVTLCSGDDDVSRRALALTGSLYVCYVFQELFSVMDPLYLLVYYAGPCLAVGFYLLFHRADLVARMCASAALGVTLAGAIAYSVYFTQPGLNSVLGHKTGLPIPRLEGLKESPERAETLKSLVTAFEDYGCRGRTVVTFNTIPVLYYLFDAEPPPGLEYIFMPYFFDPELTLRTLERSPSWCVFVSWNVLARPSADKIRAQADGIVDYLKRHSERSVPLSPRAVPAHPYDDFILYVGPAGGVQPF